MAEAPHPLDDPDAPGAVTPPKALPVGWKLAVLYVLGGAVAIIGEQASMRWLTFTGGMLMLGGLAGSLVWWRWRMAVAVRDEVRELVHSGTEPVAPPKIVTLPLVGGHLMILMYMALFIPLAYMWEAAMEKNWILCAIIGVGWAAAFPPLALVFHRRSMVHIAVSVMAWLAVVVGFPLAILLRP